MADIPPVDPDLVRKPFWLTPIPTSFLPYIGQITVLWGCYEEMFDEMLAAMVQETKHNPGPRWERRPYKARRTIFRRLAGRVFKEHGEILLLVNGMLADSGSIQNDRNLITHGRIVGILENDEEVIEARGFIRSTFCKLRLTENRLSKLFYDLGHLSGRMQCLLDADNPTLPLPQSDRSFLLAFWNRNWKSHTSARTPAPQPPTAEG